MAPVSGGDPTVMPVLRTVPWTRAVATAALRQLFAGPTPDERAAGITTTVPEGVSVVAVDVSGGLATVHLSTEFGSGGGSMSMFGRLAQVTYTVTQFPTVDRVAFEVDGYAADAFSAEGIDMDEPVSRSTYRDDWQPPIFVETPASGGLLGNPARIVGETNVFEAVFQAAILDAGGTIVAASRVDASCGTGCWGTFDVTIQYNAPAQWGTLRVWDVSPRDGTPAHVRDHRVWLSPSPAS